MATDPPQPDPTTRFFGGLLIAVGGLVFTLCGLCTLGFVGFSVFLGFTEPEGIGPAFGMVFTTLGVGGIPALGGFLLMRFGWRMYRGPRALPRNIGKVFDE